MYNYVLRPMDLIMLGGPSPFNSSEQSFRVSEKILNPIPFFGALRKEAEDIKIRFLSFVIENDIGKKDFLFPIPFDIRKIVTSRKEKKYKDGTLMKSDFISNSEDNYWISFGEEKVYREENEYIDSNTMENYLLGVLKDNFSTYVPFKAEKRVGIKIKHPQRTTDEGYLYFEEYLRLEKNVSFYIKTNSKLSGKAVKLGGESRIAIVKRTDNDVIDEFVNVDCVQEKIIKNGFFKLILLTPTNSACEISGAKMIAKIVGRPYIYSGWLRKGDKAFPSRLFKMIKPGAVFYYQIENGDRAGFVERLFEKFWLKPSLFTPDFPYFESIDGNNPICLGLTIIGSVKEVKDE